MHQWPYVWITNVDLAIRDQQAGGFSDPEQLDISIEAVATAPRPEGIRSWWNSAKWLFSGEAQKRIEYAIAEGTATSRSVVIDLEEPK